MTTQNEEIIMQSQENEEAARLDEQSEVAADESATTAVPDAETEETAEDGAEAVEPAAELPQDEAPRRSRKVNGPKVIEGNMSGASLDALTPEQEKRQIWREILSARRNKTIIELPIAGVEPPQDGASPRIFMYYKDFRVLISARDFFASNMFGAELSKAGDKERSEREFRLASRMIGAYVPFVITNAETVRDGADGQTAYIVIGSRKEAMRINRERHFFRAKAKVEEGDRIKVRVLMPTRKGLIVDALGVETFVSADKLSSCKWIDPQADFPAGSVVYMDVAGISVNKEDQTVALSLSRQAMDAADAKANYDSVKVGMRIHGTVIAVDDTYARINLDCHVRASSQIIAINGQRLHYGDRVSLSVRNKRDSNMTVYGSCIPLSRRAV